MERRLGAAVSVSAVAFGIVTWSIAHALTYLLFAHIHFSPQPVVHMHGGPWPTLIAAVGMLAAAALASAMGRVALARRRPGAAQPVNGFAAHSWITLCAPGAFVLIELGEHVASADEGPPATLLLIGVVLHTAMAAATPLLWTRFVQRAVGALLVSSSPDESTRLSNAGAFPDTTWASSRIATPLGSRGPPLRAHDTFSTLLPHPTAPERLLLT